MDPVKNLVTAKLARQPTAPKTLYAHFDHASALNHRTRRSIALEKITGIKSAQGTRKSHTMIAIETLQVVNIPKSAAECTVGISCLAACRCLNEQYYSPLFSISRTLLSYY